MLVGAAFGQLSVNVHRLPKTRSSTSQLRSSFHVALPKNKLTHTHRQRDDFADTIWLTAESVGARPEVVHSVNDNYMAWHEQDANHAAYESSQLCATHHPIRKRAGLFMRAAPKLKQIFADEGVPERLIWLAEVESAFDNNAESHAGAVGLFQLMPDTALRFGLQLQPLDERKLPEKSARAAARYLKQLHQQFQCWELALAAYNAGEGLVKRAMRNYNLTTFDELAPYLPAATRSYVPRVMAVVISREGYSPRL
jgi:hypothetical protein